MILSSARLKVFQSETMKTFLRCLTLLITRRVRIRSFQNGVRVRTQIQLMSILVRRTLQMFLKENKDKICMAHTYHTKVPYRAIARYILHYTQPGDVVLDSFCGSGMTGVAAQLCAYPDKEFRNSVKEEAKQKGEPGPKWGPRHAVLFDLSPFATFLARCFNSDLPSGVFRAESSALMESSKASLR